MSKVVTIPKDRNPFVVIVNGVKYSYPAGVTTEVPDEVADVIEKYVGAKPKPDPNAGINFGGAQSDWNQTDSSAADFIKNKPFGDEEAVLLEEQTLTFEGSETATTALAVPAVGDSVTVMWDGTEYTSQAFDFNGASVVGNGAAAGLEDTGEPFVIMFVSTEMVFVMSMDAEKTSATVKATGMSAVKIDPKYIPAIKTFYLNPDDSTDIYLYTDAAATTKATNSDMMSAIKKGEAVFSKGGIIFYGLKGAGFYGSYGKVALWDETDNATCTIYYTAEYTPTT